MEAAFGILSLFFLAIMGMIIAAIVLWIWAFVDVVKRQEWMFASGSKALWAIVVGLGGPMGALIYLLVGRPRNAQAY